MTVNVTWPSLWLNPVSFMVILYLSTYLFPYFVYLLPVLLLYIHCLTQGALNFTHGAFWTYWNSSKNQTASHQSVFFLTAPFYQFLSNPGHIQRKRKDRPKMKTVCEKSPNQVNKVLFDHSFLVQCVCSQLFAVANTISTFCEKKHKFWPVTRGKGVRLARGVLWAWACSCCSVLGSITRVVTLTAACVTLHWGCRMIEEIWNAHKILFCYIK